MLWVVVVGVKVGEEFSNLVVELVLCVRSRLRSVHVLQGGAASSPDAVCEHP